MGPIPGFGVVAPSLRRLESGLEIKSGGWGGSRPGAGRKPITPAILAEDLPISEPRWYCVRADYGYELRADIEIRRAGWELFNPSIWKPPTNPRRDAYGVVHPAKPARIVQLFPRYCFVKFVASDPKWREIAHLPGVERIMSTSPLRPIPVPEEAIDKVRSLLAPNGCLYPPKQMPKGQKINPGTKVRIESGPFASWTGMVTWSDQRRVDVLLHMMGGERPVRVSSAAVEVVG
jgi:transcription antitermination factor NusG